MWSGSGVDKLLHFLMLSLNSTLENIGYSERGFVRILLSKCKLSCQFWTELNV